MNDAVQQSWKDALRAWNVEPGLADESFREIENLYASPGRYYHTLDHVRHVLETVESLRQHARNLNAVQLAAVLHDVIYDSRAADNEECSAEYAERLCAKLTIPEGGRVAALILQTKTHDAHDDPDAQVLLDADLAILGASEMAYRAYAADIRREYAWVPEPDYRTGRSRALERFLARPKIFRFLTHREDIARRNLAAEVAELTMG